MIVRTDTVPAMKPRVYVAIVGLVLIAAALIFGFSSVPVPTTFTSQNCGSAFKPEQHIGPDFGARLDAETPKERCSAQLSGRRTPALVLFGAGVLVVLGTAVRTRKQEAATP